MAQRKSSRIERLVGLLSKAGGWVRTSELAGALGTSERTVRSYVAEINLAGTSRIESSEKGYRLAGAPAAPVDTSVAAVAVKNDRHDPTGLMRRNYVLSRLINTRGDVGVFDLADELHIGESTLANSVLPLVRDVAAAHGLEVRTHEFALRLVGDEKNKRKLLGHIATYASNDYFTSIDTLAELFPDFDVRAVFSSLVNICQRSELLVNDFALKNLLLHLLVLVIRVKEGDCLPDADALPSADEILAGYAQSREILRCSERIARYFEERYGCTIEEADRRQIVLLVAVSTDRGDNGEVSLQNLGGIVGQDFLDLIARTADELSARYGTPAFDDALRLQLTLHMFNAWQRATWRVSYHNPLATQIKSDYAPVYDMAVFFAHRVAKALGVGFDENEIAFVAFHIGAFLERAQEAGVVRCCVVVDRYHGFADALLRDVAAALGDQGAVVAAMNRSAYIADPPECDLVVTTVDVAVEGARKVVTGPILSKRGALAVSTAVEELREERRRSGARDFLLGMLRPELYARNVCLAGGRDAYIDYLGGLCVEQGLADEDFVRDVHERERASSTAFTDVLAMPHSMGAYARRSFAAVLHNDAPIPWGHIHSVSFVLLMGIAQDDMPLFRDAFDIVVDAFSSAEKSMALMRTDTFEEFVAALGA